MAIQDVFRSVTDRLQDTATVRTIYGEPIVADGRTIIPVARVRFGFGGGGGNQVSPVESDNGDKPSQSTGAGGGGGGEVIPVGYIEITAGETRFVSFEERRRIVRTVIFGLLAAIWLLRRRRRR